MNQSRQAIVRYALSVIFLCLGVVAMPPSSAAKNSPEPPMIPIGLDAYKMWDRWAYPRIGRNNQRNK